MSPWWGVDRHTAGPARLFSPALLALFHFNEALFPEGSQYKHAAGKRGVFRGVVFILGTALVKPAFLQFCYVVP